MSTLGPTRTSLHGVSEWLMSGPQYVQSGTIRLGVAAAAGFGTLKAPAVRIVGTRVIGPAGEAEIDGATITTLGAAIGVTPSDPSHLYHDSSGVQVDDVLRVDPVAAARVAEAFALGDAAVAAFAPQEQRVIWPEHFDLGIGLEGANYGVSPGDHYVDDPYAYVGPWGRKQIPHPLFNQPFGAMMPLSELPTAADVVAFFERGRDIVAQYA